MAAKKLTDTIFYIPGPTNTGIITEKEDSGRTAVYLVDSGGNSADGDRIYRELELLFPEDNGGFSVKAIINTHSHADHTGGNSAIQKKTGCQIWASLHEKGSIENSQLQPAVVCGGRPLPELLTAYYRAEETAVSRIISADTHITLSNGTRIDFTDLPGHYFDMLGVIGTDAGGRSIIFAGDAVFGRRNILKYWIPFLYDVKAFKQSLDKLCAMKAAWYVPSHGDPVKRIEETAELNKIAILSTETCIMNILKCGEITQEELLAKSADMNGIQLGLSQYVLIGCTLRAYLVYLYEEGKITYTVKNNRMTWSVRENG